MEGGALIDFLIFISLVAFPLELNGVVRKKTLREIRGRLTHKNSSTPLTFESSVIINHHRSINRWIYLIDICTILFNFLSLKSRIFFFLSYVFLWIQDGSYFDTLAIQRNVVIFYNRLLRFLELLFKLDFQFKFWTFFRTKGSYSPPRMPERVI